MTETEKQNYKISLKVKDKILEILLSETSNNLDFIPAIYPILSEVAIIFIVSSAKCGMIKGKNKAEIADNVRCMLKKIHETTAYSFEENFFGEDDE